MDNSRTEIIVGKDGTERLKQATVAVFGLGGVGGHAAEAIARAGVGRMILVDFDRISPSNLNRQIITLTENIGELKTDICEKRFTGINPDLQIVKHSVKVTPENIRDLIPENSNKIYVIDAIDDINAKIALITYLQENDFTFISSMGAGNRVNPCAVEIAVISKTSHCPLARIVRKKLREHKIYKGVTVVYSTEEPLKSRSSDQDRTIGSISYLPGIFGLTSAGYIIRKITGV